jgi:cell division protein FtsW (lipid II flippase)
MSTLVKVGLCELAFGALTGWVVVLRTEYPDVLKRIGVESPRRILQAHLDWIIMGIILIAVGVALPDLPTWLAWVLGFGAIVNASLFVPLAFRESFSTALPYRIITLVSFTAMSVGTVGAAAFALGA